MPQLIENKQNDPALIANFEPNEIATKSEEKTKFKLENIAQVHQRKRKQNFPEPTNLRGVFPGLDCFGSRDYFSSAGVAVAGPSPTISRTASESLAPS